MPWHYIYARLSTDEYELVRKAADKVGLTMSGFVREAVNNVFMEQGDDAPLLSLPKPGARARMTKADIRP